MCVCVCDRECVCVCVTVSVCVCWGGGGGGWSGVKGVCDQEIRAGRGLGLQAPWERTRLSCSAAQVTPADKSIAVMAVPQISDWTSPLVPSAKRPPSSSMLCSQRAHSGLDELMKLESCSRG